MTVDIQHTIGVPPDPGLKKFAADVEEHLRPLLPKRLRLTCERYRTPTGMEPAVVLLVWDEHDCNVGSFLHWNTDPVDPVVALTWSHLISRALMRFEVEREKHDG